jgi:hypothetical protein
MKRSSLYLLAGIAILLLTAVHFTSFTFVSYPLDGCENQPKTFQLHCEFKNPEDLVRSPIKNHILVSEFRGVVQGENTGFISSLDLTSNNRVVLYPTSASQSELNTDKLWGEPSCATPPRHFSPHGIDLVKRSDGRYALYVVNHGNREAIEMFEFNPQANSVSWKGCVVAPEGLVHNDVSALADGSFYTSAPFANISGSHFVGALKGAFLNEKTGLVAHWSPHQKYQTLPWTSGSYTNGVQVSADGKTLFVNQYFEGSLVKYDIATQRELGRVKMLPADNINWTEDGYLLSTSHQDYLPRLDRCLKRDMPYCPIATKVYKINPETLDKQIIFETNGQHFGFGTAAIDSSNKLLIGTAAGNRLAVVAL